MACASATSPICYSTPAGGAEARGRLSYREGNRLGGKERQVSKIIQLGSFFHRPYCGQHAWPPGTQLGSVSPSSYL